MQIADKLWSSDVREFVNNYLFEISAPLYPPTALFHNANVVRS